MQMGKRLFRKSFKRKQKQQEVAEHAENKMEERYGDEGISSNLQENIDFLHEAFGKAPDIIIRQFVIKHREERKAAIVFIDEMVDKDLINRNILRPLMIDSEKVTSTDDLWDLVTERLVSAGETKNVLKKTEILTGVLAGDTVLLIDQYEQGYVVGTKGWATKSISEPRSESVVRGSREGLSETIVLSLAMIRRRVKDPDLRVCTYELGKRTKTCVNLLYMDGLIDPQIVMEVEQRLKRIQIDGVLESGYVEELIQDQTWTPFSQLQNTERPDTVVAHLLEGKVAILIDGSPHALIAPAIFTQFYFSAEDYYERFWIATFLRIVRLISFFMALLLPAFYIALVSFHPEMIPSHLAISMAAGRATVPFSAILEALMMELSVEILREASVRLPGPIGPTIGIVGALVIGDAAVTAGLVSPAMVIVVGLTTISSYANPSYSAAISVRLLRFPFMIAASVLGLYGIMLLFFLLCAHLVQLRSFGVPYMAPYAPFNLTDLKDSLFRASWKYMNMRPVTFKPQDRQRQTLVHKGKDENSHETSGR